MMGLNFSLRYFKLFGIVQDLQALPEGLQVMSQSNTSQASRRNGKTPFGQFVTGCLPTIGRILKHHMDDMAFKGWTFPVLVVGFASGEFLKGGLPTGLVPLFNPVVTVAGLALRMTGLRNIM